MWIARAVHPTVAGVGVRGIVVEILHVETGARSVASHAQKRSSSYFTQAIRDFHGRDTDNAVPAVDRRNRIELVACAASEHGEAVEVQSPGDGSRAGDRRRNGREPHSRRGKVKLRGRT